MRTPTGAIATTRPPTAPLGWKAASSRRTPKPRRWRGEDGSSQSPPPPYHERVCPLQMRGDFFVTSAPATGTQELVAKKVVPGCGCRVPGGHRMGVCSDPRNLEPGTAPVALPPHHHRPARSDEPLACPLRHWPSPARIGPIGLIRPIRPIRLCDRQAPRLRPVPLQPINEFPPRKVRVRRKRKSESRSPRWGLLDLWRKRWFRVAGAGFRGPPTRDPLRPLEPGTWNRSRGLAPS